MKISVKTVLSFVFVLCILAYILMPTPFVFIVVSSASIRIGIEFAILLTFITFFYSTQLLRYLPTSFVMLIGISLWLVIGNPTLASTDGYSVPSLIAKLSMLIIGAFVLKQQPTLLQLISRAWVLLWLWIPIHAILASFVFNLGLVDFLPVEFYPISKNPILNQFEGIVHVDYFHPLFGFINNWDFFGYNFAKVTHFMFEPLPLGFFCGLNVVGASLIMAPKSARYFRSVNFIAGLCTGSVSFYLFFTLLGIYKIICRFGIKKKNNASSKLRIICFSLGLFLVAALFLVVIARYSSLSDRLFRLALGVNLLLHSSPHSFLFGNLLHPEITAMVGADRGISSGFLTILVQRGIMTFLFMCYVLYTYSKKSGVLLLFFIFYGLLMEYFWWPAFIIGLLVFGVSAELKVDNAASEERLLVNP